MYLLLYFTPGLQAQMGQLLWSNFATIFYLWQAPALLQRDEPFFVLQ